jgi:hypothetical protein
MNHRILLTSLISLGIATATVTANPPDPANYIGAKMCGVCHKADATGNQLAKWQASPHAKAYETLGTPAAKEIAQKLGIDDPQKSGKCLKCHSTAYNFTELVATEKIKVEEGVSCESCHGPGKKYMPKAIMEDREKSIANGLIYPATKTCTLCHNSESPTFKGFDEKAFVEKIAHPNPKAKK